MYKVQLSLYSKDTGECLRKKVIQSSFKRTLLMSLSHVLDKYLKEDATVPYVMQIDNLSDRTIQELNLLF